MLGDKLNLSDIDFGCSLDRCAARGCGVRLEGPFYNRVRAMDDDGNVVMARLCGDCTKALCQGMKANPEWEKTDG